MQTRSGFQLGQKSNYLNRQDKNLDSHPKSRSPHKNGNSLGLCHPCRSAGNWRHCFEYWCNFWNLNRQMWLKNVYSIRVSKNIDGIPSKNLSLPTSPSRSRLTGETWRIQFYRFLSTLQINRDWSTCHWMRLSHDQSRLCATSQYSFSCRRQSRQTSL